MFKLRIGILLLPFLMILNCSCSSIKDIAGLYRSNFAEYGFFVTKLTLKPDSTFGYRMRGDLLDDTARGRYSVIRKKIRMKYNKPVFGLGGYINTGYNDSVRLQPEIVGDRGPKIYWIGHHKLFSVDSLGNKKSRSNGYSKHKKFLFWGDHYSLNRRYFFKKIK